MLRRLFNAYPNATEPDWRLFDAIEVQPMQQDEQADGSTYTYAVDDSAHAAFWCVFGHLKAGGTESITDVDDEAQAAQLARVFELLVANNNNNEAVNGDTR